MSNKIILELLTQKEALFVSAGISWQWIKNLAGGAADVFGGISEKFDKFSGNPKEQEKPVELPCAIPSEVEKVPDVTPLALEKYDWCTCGFKNGTVVQLKPKL